uniref:DNA ligase n=1 Tax=Heterorhabditis bacteriophora TaxID=37862 RepID=A0A1I7XUH7_HETBA
MPRECPHALRLAKISPNPFVQNTEGPPPDMKQYFHANCLFETFFKARATTKVIEEPGDIEGWSEMTQEDKDEVIKLIEELQEVRAKKGGNVTKTPQKKRSSDEIPTAAKTPSSSKKTISENIENSEVAITVKEEEVKKPTKIATKRNEKENTEITIQEEQNEESKYNSFYKFCKLCDVIASISKYTDKSTAVKIFINKGDYDGDTLTLIRLLLPGIDQRVYNIKEKQIIKHFATLYGLSHAELTDAYKNDGDVSKTIRNIFEDKKLSTVNKSNWSIQKVDRWLNRLTQLTKDEEQMTHIKFAAKRLSPLELQYLLRLVKKDLRINAGVKHILDGLHSSAYEAFQSCHDLDEIVNRCSLYYYGSIKGRLGDVIATMEVCTKLGTPVLPMLAEPCKSVEQAMSKCVNGMYAEIKYDGERVQVHKNGTTFTYYSRSLKPVQHHKISHLEKFLPEAFPEGLDLIIDAEVLLVDTLSGKPLPFGTLGVHKKQMFKDASVCLFIFDILQYNDDNLLSRPLIERKKLLKKHMTEVPNRVMMSNYQHIPSGDCAKLKTLIWKAIDEGLEGLVLKDINSTYEPGKRHWLKVKKDYIDEGKMADSADLIVLGAYFGTGNKGSLITRIDGDFNRVPKWLCCSRSVVPDFIVMDPKTAPIWEITGAEFSKSENHTAEGISIRFPRVTRVRNDKDWKTATSLTELVVRNELYNRSKSKSDVGDSIFDDEIPLYAKDGMSNEIDEEYCKDSPKHVEITQKQKRKHYVDDNNSLDEDIKEARGKRIKREKVDDKTQNIETKSEMCQEGKTACKYGLECYRKSKEHREKYWHP